VLLKCVCVLVCVLLFFRKHFLPFSLKAADVAVGLQAGEEDVEEPQAQEQQASDQAGPPRAPELAADGGPPSVHQHAHADKGEYGEERDREGQRARVHLELLALDPPVDGGH